MYFPDELWNELSGEMIAAASLVYVCLPKTRNLFIHFSEAACVKRALNGPQTSRH